MKHIIPYLFLCLIAFGCQPKGTQATVVERPDMSVKNTNYVSNKSPLLPSAFIKLPVGSIQPGGWLKKYLELQLDGLTGQFNEITAWLEKKNNA